MKPLVEYFLALPRPLGYRLLPCLRYSNLMRNLEMRVLAEWFKEPQGMRILDAGCGETVYALFLVEQGASLLGVDISHRYLTLAQELTSGLGLTGRAQYVVADLAALPLPPEYFDAVVCNCVLEHVTQEDEALQEMRRVLKPEGRFFLTIDCLDRSLWLSPLDRLPRWTKRLFLKAEIASAPTVERGLYENLDRIYGILRRYRRQELVGEMEALGFRVVETRYYLTRLGALLFELLHSLKGLDATKGLGRFVFITISLLSAPLLVIFKDISTQHPGHGLALLAVKVP